MGAFTIVKIWTHYFEILKSISPYFSLAGDIFNSGNQGKVSEDEGQLYHSKYEFGLLDPTL